MKNIGLTLLFIASAAATAQAQFGAEMGLNMANLAIKSGGAKAPSTFKPGFAIGILGDIALSQHMYFEPGLYYDMTGCKLTGTPAGSYNVNTVTIPLNLEFKTGDKCGSRFFAGIGPYIGYNVGGNYTIDANGSFPAISAPLVIGTANTDNLKALEAGAGLNFGYQLKMRLYARAHYQMGFTELSPVADGNNGIKSSAFGVTLGFFFGRCSSGRIPGFGSTKGNHWRGMSKAKWSTRRRYMRNN